MNRPELSVPTDNTNLQWLFLNLFLIVWHFCFSVGRGLKNNHTQKYALISTRSISIFVSIS